ncbi:MAG: hypothetical protein COB40_01475 [Marinosulfonomonas sp.]|nr:MAG: hypothetical protein COB40_01475 [Marinosulfonomonas sp.]
MSNMFKLLKNFRKNSNGNVTIDWIVLSAGIVSLGLTVGVSISTPANGVADDINTAMVAIEPTSY